MRSLFRDEEGFTTTSMVLSLLITLALLFTAAQVYRIDSASAEVQDVADAAALAAESQVGEFMIVARFCDAVVLTLSLSGIAACGLGVVALCMPATATLSEGLIEAGAKIIEARDKFAERAQSVLDKLQKALPFYAAACAAGVSAANNGDSSNAEYLGVALLVPGEGVDVDADTGDAASDLVEDVGDKADGIREKAAEAEKASQEANKAKQKAFKRDCGDSPNRCMHERAASLIGLSGAANPLYSSVDAWSFSVAFERAKGYYGKRRLDATPSGQGTAKDAARAQLQKNYCSYMYGLLVNEGYVRESGDSFDANFPHAPKTVAEMRGTSLYTDQIYPITEEPADDGGDPMPVMHAWAGCPGATSDVVGYDSVYYMETANLATCPECEFTVQSIGKIASANTSIDTGFEYHYEAVAEAAAEYKEARKLADKSKAAVKKEAGGLFDDVLDALKEAVGKRIEVEPPGRYGSVAFVVNAGTTSTAGGFASGFAASASLGTRAAVSASTLVDEGSEEGRNAVNSLLDGLKQGGGAAVGAAGIVLDVWSRLLGAYAGGVDALASGIESGLNAIPLAGASGLGPWAADKFRGVLDGVGLQPAELEALKPVLVNSFHVASKDDSASSKSLVEVKRRVVSHPMNSTDLFSGLLTEAEEAAIGKVGELGGSAEVVSVELFGGTGASIPITIPLPGGIARRYGISAIEALFARVRSFYSDVTGVRVWE